MKLKLKSLALFALAFIGTAILITSCISFDDDRPPLIDADGNPPLEQTVQLEKTSLHYLESGDRDGTPVVFIHGTPGSLGFFSGYLVDPRFKANRTLVIDRPGWGSSAVTNDFEPTLSFQSEALGEWLCQVKSESPTNRLVIVAHSYGATLTPKLAMDHPDCISAALLLAGGADPALTAPRWYNLLTHYPPVSWLVSLSRMGLKKSNNEMMNVKTELEKMVNGWESLTLPITVIQGEEDALVHPDNADFIEEKLAHIPAKIIRIDGAGHVLRESHRDLIISEALKLLQ